MKSWLITAVCMVGFVTPAIGQGAGSIELYSDSTAMDCGISDEMIGAFSVYIFHTNLGCATSSQFSAPAPDCMTDVFWFGDATPFFSLGDSQAGIGINYGMALAQPTLILTISYFGSGLTPPCCEYNVLPDPALPSGQVEAGDCGAPVGIIFPTAGNSFVNPNGTCIGSCKPPAVLPSTWGYVKALYSD